METGRADLEIDGAVAEIVFSNPDGGLMDESMEQRFLDAVERVEGDPAIRACVRAGGGEGVFIRHYDLKVLAPRARSMAGRGMSFSTDRPVPEAPIHKALRMIEGSAKIYIAALNGTAMGGGFETALACDLRVVQDGPFEFGLPEVNLGILPGAGGTQRLRELAGVPRALQMALTGDRLDPAGMVGAGLAAARVPDARKEAMALARRLAGKPARAAAHIKRLVRGAGPGGFAEERTLFCDLMVQPDAVRLLEEGAQGARAITDEP